MEEGGLDVYLESDEGLWAGPRPQDAEEEEELQVASPVEAWEELAQ